MSHHLFLECQKFKDFIHSGPVCFLEKKEERCRGNEEKMKGGFSDGLFDGKKKEEGKRRKSIEKERRKLKKIFFLP